jgi:hypothetical protein
MCFAEPLPFRWTTAVSLNHCRFPKEDQLPDWARWDNQVKKGDREQKLQLPENWALKYLRKLAHLQLFINHCLGISKNFTAHQNKDTRYVLKLWTADC